MCHDTQYFEKFLEYLILFNLVCVSKNNDIILCQILSLAFSHFIILGPIYICLSFLTVIWILIHRSYLNQYDRGHRGCTLMSSLYKLTGTDEQADGQTCTSKYRDACASKNGLRHSHPIPNYVLRTTLGQYKR